MFLNNASLNFIKRKKNGHSEADCPFTLSRKSEEFHLNLFYFSVGFKSVDPILT